jgi:nucleotide-binding universal stress UspA family protein
MKTILVPTDFSENAANALNYASSLADQVNGKLIIVHVVNLVVIPVRSGKLVNLTGETDMHSYLKLSEIASELRESKNLECEVAVIDQYELGSFRESLNQIVIAKKVDLVVMGTKGATNFLDKLIGTNTSGFIKVATCPVLVIPASAQYSAIKHLAYASDFENDKRIFLERLFRFTESLHSQVSVSILDVSPSHHLDIAAEEQNIQEIAKNFSNINYSIVQVNEIDVVTGIQTFVRDHQVDVLAISIREQDFFEDFFQSSYSKQLVYHTTLPLLALPKNLDLA